MASSSTRIPTFIRAGRALLRTIVQAAQAIWSPLYRRVLGGSLAVLLPVVCLHNRYADRQWEEYRQAAIARGAVLDLPRATLSLVADAENFAAADGPFAPVPVGAQVPPFDRKLDFTGIHVDFPDLDHGRRKTIEEACANLSEPARKASPSVDSSASETERPRNAEEFLRYFDERFAGAWPAILDAEAKPRTQYPVSFTADGNPRMPLLVIRKAAQMHTMRAMALLELQRHEEALKEIRGSLRLVRAVESDHASGMVTYLAGAAIASLTLDAVWEGLVDRRWSETDLRALREELAAIRPEADWHDAVGAERMQENFLFDELAAGLSLRQRFGAPPSVWLSCCSNGLIRENQIAVNQAADAALRLLDQDGRWHPEDAFLRETERRKDRFDYSLAAIIGCSYERAAARVAALEARLRQADLAIALERYRQRQGDLPERLQALIPEFLAEIPADPVDGGPIRYLRDSNDSHRLLSRAENGIPGSTQLWQVAELPRESSADLVWFGLAPMEKGAVARAR